MRLRTIVRTVLLATACLLFAAPVALGVGTVQEQRYDFVADPLGGCNPLPATFGTEYALCFPVPEGATGVRLRVDEEGPLAQFGNGIAGWVTWPGSTWTIAWTFCDEMDLRHVPADATEMKVELQSGVRDGFCAGGPQTSYSFPFRGTLTAAFE